jgi:hypothetical protein
LGDQAPVFTDERLTVYRLEPPAAPQPFLVLGSGWGPRQVEGERVTRALQPQADLHIIHARPSTLAITARGPAGALLHVRDEAGRELGQLALQPAWTTYAVRLPGSNPGARLELAHDAALDQVLLSALSLTADE